MAPSRLVLASLALLAALAAAGCLADTGGTSSAPADAGGGPGTQGASGGGSPDGSGADSDADGSNATAPEDGSTGWRNQTRTGGFSGANVVFGIFGKTESFPVSEDAVNLTLVVRAPDAELDGQISAPCSGGTGCGSTSYQTAGGRYTHEVTDPEPGEWSVSFFRGEAGAGHQRYVLEIHRQVQTAG